MCVARDRAKVIAITNEGKVEFAALLAAIAITRRQGGRKRCFQSPRYNRTIMALRSFKRTTAAASTNKSPLSKCLRQNKKANMNAFDVFHRTTTKSPTHCTADAVKHLLQCLASGMILRKNITIASLFIRTHVSFE